MNFPLRTAFIVYHKPHSGAIPFRSSLDKIHTFQGKRMGIKIIKQKEQRHGRNKSQKNKSKSGGKFSEY